MANKKNQWHKKEFSLAKSSPEKLANYLSSKRYWGPRNSTSRTLPRALRLLWFWFQWKKHRDRAWTNLDIPCNTAYIDLFNASTTVTVDNGKTALFWMSS